MLKITLIFFLKDKNYFKVYILIFNYCVINKNLYYMAYKIQYLYASYSSKLDNAMRDKFNSTEK